MIQESAQSEPTGTAVRCLVVLPHGADAPGALLDGLRERGLPIREVGDAPTAMAELAQYTYNVLVIVEPQRLPESDRLASSVGRYHPNVRIWQYGQSGIRELQNEQTSQPAGPEIRIPSPALVAPNLAPPEPIEPRDLFEPAGAVLAPEDGSSLSSVTLTTEELTMLLSDDPSGRDGGTM